MLRQFELARLIGIRPYNAIAFSGPIAVFVSVFSSTLSDNPVGSLRRLSVSRRFSASFSSSRVFITGRLNPFHMMGVAGILGGALLLRFMVLQRTRCIKMVNKQTHSKHLTQPKKKKPTPWLPPTDFGHKFSVLHLVIRGAHFFMLFVPVMGLWTSSIGIIGLALNLRAYDFVSQEIREKTPSLRRSILRTSCSTKVYVLGWRQ